MSRQFRSSSSSSSAGSCAFSYIVEDIEVRGQGITASHAGAIVGDLDGVVESVQVDAINDQRHGCRAAHAL